MHNCCFAGLFETSTAGNATITNNSTFVFLNSSNAGTSTITNNASLTFADATSADQAKITNSSTGTTTFSFSSTAAQAIITNAGTLIFTVASGAGTSTITNTGTMTFTDDSTANQAKIANSAALNFMGASTGGMAMITTNSGGTTSFFDSSTGGSARFITNAGATFDMSTLTASGMTAGSIEGAGNYFLASKELTTGLNNLSTTVSGVIADGGASGGTGGSLVKVGTGTLTLTGANTYTGPTTISQGAINLTGSLLSPVSVESAGTLGSTGTVFNTVTNAGTVEPGLGLPTGTFGNLTAYNYVGASGILALRTYLAGDGSPSDTLTITHGGVATGSTSINIANVGGPGAETTANGILVVNATNGAMTAPGAFALSVPELRAGAYHYDLLRGGLGGSDPQDWFLRSSFVLPGPGPGPEPPQPPIVGPTPPPNPLPPGMVFPIIGPELATYGVVQPLARQLGLTILGTLDDRIGDTYEPDGCGVAPAIAPAALPTRKPGPAPASCPLFSPSVWGRFFGQTVNNRYQAFAEPHADGNLGGFQGGIDLLRGSLIAGHYERAGLYGAYGDTNVNVDGLVTNPAATAYIFGHTGSVHLDSWSGGAYWTHVGPGGWYLDAVLQGTSYGGSASTQFARLNTDGWGFIASLEGGVPFAFPQLGPGFVLEPQGQIAWQKVSFGQRNDGLGEVALGDTTGTTGRVGLRGKWTIVTGDGQVWQPYVRGNLWQDWGPNATTTYAGTDIVPLVTRATLLEFGGGVTGRINANVSVFANVDYEFAVGAANGERQNGVRGAFGARYTW